MPKKPKVKAKEVVAILRRSHEERGSYNKKNPDCFFEELRVGTGFAVGNDQRIDAFAIHTFPSRGLIRTAYEVKVSRQDFLNELKNPEKRKFAMLMSNQFYFVTSPGIVKEGELPPDCGLKIYHPERLNLDQLAETYLGGHSRESHRRIFKTLLAPENKPYETDMETGPQLICPIPAPFRDSYPPTWGFTAAIARRVKLEAALLHADLVKRVEELQSKNADLDYKLMMKNR